MSASVLRIGERSVGAGHPTFIIAEIGVNHDGSLRRALELVELAGACGADAVKLQLFTAAALMHGSSQFADYQQQRVEDADPAAMLRRYELPLPHVQEIVAGIRKRGLIPVATPFSPSDIQTIADLQLPAVKIASPDLVNRPLLQRAASLNVPMIVSTGASTLEEVATAWDWLDEWDSSFAFLHCISSYPTPSDQTNLCWIAELLRRFAVPVGFSDHTNQSLAGALAVATGASIIEKHLTYDRSAKGPDHAASCDPDQFAKYVTAIRLAETLRGTPSKRVLDIEQDVRRVSRQSLVVTRDFHVGETLTEMDITVQRPGTGISAAEVTAAVGRRVLCAIPQGTLLQWDMLADAA